MVNAANMLLETPVAPEQVQASGTGQAAKDQDPSNSAFHAIVQDLMGSSEETTTEPVQAGQQAEERGQTQTDGETDKPSKDAVALAGSLVGSVQIACGEVQALPAEVATDGSATADVSISTAQSSTAVPVAPNSVQPIAAEQQNDVPASADTAQATQVASTTPGQSAPSVQTAEVAQAAAAAQPLPEMTTDTEVPSQDTGTVGRPAQAAKTAEPAPTQTTAQPSDARPEAATQVDQPSGKVAAREHAERTEAPEYMRTVTPQQDIRFGSKVIISEDAQSIRSVAEADPELAAAPVSKSAGKDTGALQTDVRQSVPWTPIEVRPAANDAVPTPAVTAQTQPVDQVDRANIINQIVRTAKVHVFDGGGEMTMRLEPAHLGSIQMSVTADQGIVTAHLKAGTESVRQALEAGLPALRQSLTEAGIHVDSVSVSVGDTFSQSWNMHAGAHSGSQFAGNQQDHGYANNMARFFRGEGDAVSVDQPSSAYTGAGFNYLA